MSIPRFLKENGERADTVREYLRQLIRICIPFVKMSHGPDAEATAAGVDALLQQAAHEVVYPPGYTDEMRASLFATVMKLVHAGYDPSLEKTLEHFQASLEQLDAKTAGATS